MTDLDLKIFIGNRTSNLYVTLERLIKNDFPRGLFNEYESSMLEISELQNLETSSNFFKVYESEIEQQARIFKGTDLENVSLKIAVCKTPTLLKQYCDTLFAENFVSFLYDEKQFLEEFMATRSRRKTKTDYLTKVLQRLSFARQLLTENSFLDESLQKEISESEKYAKNELQKLGT
jgi:hypothetical protein